LPTVCPGGEKVKGGIVSILDGSYDLCIIGEKFAVVVDVAWHVVDEQGKQEWPENGTLKHTTCDLAPIG